MNMGTGEDKMDRGDCSSRVASLRVLTERLKGRAEAAAQDQRKWQGELQAAISELDVVVRARALLQAAAKRTQDQLCYHVTELGSMALGAVFPEEIRMELIFRENRGKTEARLLFGRGGEDSPHYLDPLEEDSGGACTVAALGLRVSMWSLQNRDQNARTRPIFVMDEPGGHVNDPTREIHRKFAEMMGEVAGKMGVQFLVVSMVEELVDAGERVAIKTR